jgi:hypothetical protein
VHVKDIVTAAVKSITLEGCAFDKPDQFAALHHAKFEYNGGELMTDKRIFAPAVTLRYMKLVIHEGWNAFAAVSKCVASVMACFLFQVFLAPELIECNARPRRPGKFPCATPKACIVASCNCVLGQCSCVWPGLVALKES